MKNVTDLLSGITFLALVLFGFSLTASLPKPLPGAYFGPASFPNLLLILIAVGACGLIGKALLAKASSANTLYISPQAFCFILLFFAYLVGFLTFGFLIATVPFLIGAQYLFGRRKIIGTCFTAICGTAGIYTFITFVFKVPLP